MTLVTHWHIYGLGCFIIVSGAVLQWYFPTWEAFPRSGAVLTALSVILLPYVISFNERQKERFVSGDRGFRENPLSSSDEQFESDAYQSSWGDSLRETYDELAKYGLLQGSIPKSNIRMLALGTLVWGFGDLLFSSECVSC